MPVIGLDVRNHSNPTGRTQPAAAAVGPVGQPAVRRESCLQEHVPKHAAPLDDEFGFGLAVDHDNSDRLGVVVGGVGVHVLQLPEHVEKRTARWAVWRVDRGRVGPMGALSLHRTDNQTEGQRTAVADRDPSGCDMPSTVHSKAT